MRGGGWTFSHSSSVSMGRAPTPCYPRGPLVSAPSCPQAKGPASVSAADLAVFWTPGSIWQVPPPFLPP